jgi:hypothetical protein
MGGDDRDRTGVLFRSRSEERVESVRAQPDRRVCSVDLSFSGRNLVSAGAVAELDAADDLVLWASFAFFDPLLVGEAASDGDLAALGEVSGACVGLFSEGDDVDEHGGVVLVVVDGEAELADGLAVWELAAYGSAVSRPTSTTWLTDRDIRLASLHSGSTIGATTG